MKFSLRWVYSFDDSKRIGETVQNDIFGFLFGLVSWFGLQEGICNGNGDIENTPSPIKAR